MCRSAPPSWRPRDRVDRAARADRADRARHRRPLMVELRWGAATDTGRVRGANEDSVLAIAQVFAVADGMGGHAAGEVASAVTLDALRDAIVDRPVTAAVVTDAV